MIQISQSKSSSEGDYINFGEFCRTILNMQCQSGVHYLLGYAGCPNLSRGLRIIGHPSNYHEIKIHREDANLFRKRLMDHRSGKKIYGDENDT